MQEKLKKRSIIDLKSHSQAMRLKNYGTLRLRAMLAIASLYHSLFNIAHVSKKRTRAEIVYGEDFVAHNRRMRL
jgi:hypothetical protein